MESFLTQFSDVVCDSIGADYSDNYDELRFGKLPAPPRLSLAPKALFLRWLKSQGFDHVWRARDTVRCAMEFVSPYLPRLERLHARLADDESRNLLAKLMAFRALGHRKVKLPLNTPSYWLGIQEYERHVRGADTVASGFRGWELKRVDLRPDGIPVSLYTLPAGAYSMFKLEQYRCSCPPGEIAAAQDDIVMDCGGCWGDTALYFANRVGASGRVFTFEFLAAHLEILRKNLELNPTLAARVEIVERALWEESNVKLNYFDNGPGTSVALDASSKSTGSAMTLSIDDFVTGKELPRVDFIKMDIEGAELSALRGAVHSLTQFRPKLAICVYHRFEDIFEIPDYLASLDLGYRFYLRHFSIHAEETVLFATREQTGAALHP